MSDYPYVLSYPSIGRLFETVKSTGVPQKVDSAWLKTVGFRSGNDGRLLTILNTLGFTDGSKAPTQRWQEYRGADGKHVLGEAIQEGYSALYNVYPEAHKRTSEEILNVIRSSTTLADETAKRAVKTFESLVKLASFTNPNYSQPASRESVDVEAEPTAHPVQASTPSSPLNINLNVELTLPETTNSDVYDAFFKSMKEHLLSEK